jgi:hypothetical protein
MLGSSETVLELGLAVDEKIALNGNIGMTNYQQK